MEESQVPHLDIEITESNLTEGVAKIAEVLRPSWKPDQIQVKDRSSGYINRNYHCFVPNDHESFFLRIGNSAIPDLVNTLHNSMRYLKHRQLGAELLLTFTNGVVMEFIEGQVVNWHDIDKVLEPETWLSYAREMAKFHANTNEDDGKKFNIPTREESNKKYYDMMQKSIDSGKLTDEELNGLPTSEQINEWTEKIYKQLVDAGAEIKFCHEDSNPTNLIIREDKSVVIVDYDDCVMTLPCMEIAVAFVSFGGLPDFDIDKMPSEQQQDHFLREYLKTTHELEGKGEVTEKTVEFWKFLLRKAHLYQILFFLVIVITTQLDNVANRPINVSLCHVMLDMYNKDKHKVLAETFSWD